MDVLTKRAKELRKHQTKEEQKLWEALRKRSFQGYKFYRQFVIKPYIVDFICKELKLIIELDGGQHMDNAEYDQQRTEYLQSKGYKVLRFWNNQIHDHFGEVLDSIFELLSYRKIELKKLNKKL